MIIFLKNPDMIRAKRADWLNTQACSELLSISRAAAERMPTYWTCMNYVDTANERIECVQVPSGTHVTVAISQLHLLSTSLLFRYVGSIEAQRDRILETMHTLSAYQGTMANNPTVIEVGSRKDYLMALQENGFPVIPTRAYENGTLHASMLADGDANIRHIIKPITGELGNSVAFLDEVDDTWLRRKERIVGGWIVQPFIDSIWSGEVQLRFMGNENVLTLKKQCVRGDRALPDQSDRHWLRIEPSADMLELAQSLKAFLENNLSLGFIHCCRFDFIPTEKGLLILECEIVNPGMGYFNCDLEERIQLSNKLIDVITTEGAKSTQSSNTGKQRITLQLGEELDDRDNTHIKQSFSVDFQSALTADTPISITNAGETDYPKGWNDYTLFVDQGVRRTRVACEYDGTECQLTARAGTTSISWFPDYTRQDLLHFMQAHQIPLQQHDDLPTISLGNATKPSIVLFARQHPGECMSSYFLEGLVTHAASAQTHNYHLIVFPLMNVTGVEQQQHRYTPDGKDLNRRWRTDEASIQAVKTTLSNRDVAAVIDVHGDEVTKRSYGICQPKHNTIFQRLFPDLLLIPPSSHIKRFLKQLIRQKSWTWPFTQCTAQAYFAAQKIPAMTLELSAHTSDPDTLKQLGKQCAEQLLAP